MTREEAQSWAWNIIATRPPVTEQEGASGFNAQDIVRWLIAARAAGMRDALAITDQHDFLRDAVPAIEAAAKEIEP